MTRSALRLIRGQNLNCRFGSTFPELSDKDVKKLRAYSEHRWTSELNAFWINLLLRHATLMVYENDFTITEDTMSGIKELNDVLDSADAMIDTYDKVMADGKIDLADLVHLPALLIAFREAVEGAKTIPDELTGATPEELGSIVVKVVGLVKKVASHIGK